MIVCVQIQNKFTSLDDSVAELLANGLVCTGFAFWYRLKPKVGF